MNNDHDCFYHYENNYNGLAHHLVPYCIRYNSINSNQKCLGTPYTFDQLHSMDITSDQLWQWFAPVDLIDIYAAYLITEKHNRQTEQIYCNCSSRLSFGTHCQYQFMIEDDTSNFTEIIKRNSGQFKTNQYDLYLINETNSSTCYIAFNCTTFTGFCLDWREINDGSMHCMDGEDEKHFIDMEISECDAKTEYRCESGLCIPRSFLLDRTFDCPDRSDEASNFKKYYEINGRCSTDGSTGECEEYRLSLNYFSCGNGQHLAIRFHTEDNCWNLRDALLIKTIFRPYFHTIRDDPCGLMMLCLFNALHFFSYFPHGSKQYCKELLSSSGHSSCPETFVFPPGPFVFSYVRLLYTSGIPRSITPSFLCWNRSVFHFRHQKSNVKVDGFHCMKAGLSYFDTLFTKSEPNMYQTTILILVIQRLFSEYFNPDKIQKLYKCHSCPLFISTHRIMNEDVSDCMPWLIHTEEEAVTDANRNIACRLPDRYPCATEKACVPRTSLGDGIIDCSAIDDEIFFVSCTDEFDCNYLRENDVIQRLVNYQEICNDADIFKTYNIEM